LILTLCLSVNTIASPSHQFNRGGSQERIYLTISVLS